MIKKELYQQIKSKAEIIDFKDRDLYLTGTNIGAIVKYYKGYDFATYNHFNLIASMLKWTVKERDIFNNKASEDKEALFQIGKDFENHIASVFQEMINNNGEVKDFSGAETSFAIKDLKLCATPDFLITTTEGNISLVETKAGSRESKYLTSYKYQVALQSLVIPEFDIYNDNTQIIIFFGSDLKTATIEKQRYIPFICNKEEIKRMQSEIVECAEKFWIDVENNNHSFISFNEVMLFFKDKKLFIETDENHINIFENLIFLKETIKELEEETDKINKALLEGYSDYDKIQFGEMSQKITIVKTKDTKIDKFIIQENIKKKQRELAELRKLRQEIGEQTIIKSANKKLYIKIV